MQNELKSTCAGTVAKVHVEEGSTVETGVRLVEVWPLEANKRGDPVHAGDTERTHVQNARIWA
jgi:hypothetical protein